MDSKKTKQGTTAGTLPQGLRYAQRSPTNSGGNPGHPTMPGSNPFAGMRKQGPVPQQLIGRQKGTLPQGYPIGPSSRQGMGSRLGDSTNLNDQIQQLQRFKGSFNPAAQTNSQQAARAHAPQGGPGAGQRTNRSSAIGLDETNVPITERGQAIKSARHQPKALTQMKPNLISSEYATQPEDISGYSTGGFKNVSQTSRIEPTSHYAGKPIEEQTWRYPADNKQNYRAAANHAPSNPYAADNQIKFQGDLGDDMLPPNTDDDESQDERREDVGGLGRAHASPRRDHPNKNMMSHLEKLDDTPSVGPYKQVQNPNTSNSLSQQSQKKQNKNFMTFNEISELELTQSQIQANDVPSDRQMEGFLDRMPHRITEDQREDEQTDNSDVNSANALYHPIANDKRRQKNVVETANMMYQLAGTKNKATGHSRQRQFQTAADMSGYEGDQDQYRHNSRGRFHGGKIESRKKKKATQQLAAARNANKKFKDAYQGQTQSLRTSQKKGSVTVPMSQIELNLDEQLAASEQNQSQSISKQAQQAPTTDSQVERQQTGVSAISGISALSLISGNSGLSAAAAQSSDKHAYQSIQQTLKPQSQIVDIQVQPNSGAHPKSQGMQPGVNDISISEAYQTKPQMIEVDGLRIEHESQPIVAEMESGGKGADRNGRASPVPSAPSKVVDLTGISGTSTGVPPAMKSKPPNRGKQEKEPDKRGEAFREMIEKMNPTERKQLQKQSATKIQKWVRGHIARKTARKQKEINFRQMRKLRRMLSVAYGKTRTKLIKQLVHVLKESGNLHSDQNYQLWKKYQAHCATIIQRHWRGYSLRYLQIEKFNEMAWKHKQSRLLCALVKGYKTRLLLHEDGYHQGISRVKMDIQRVANQDNGKALIIDVNDKLTLKNLMKRRRLKVIELIRIFNKAYQTQGIIVQLLNQKRKLATQDKLKQMGNQTRSSGDSRKMLSGTQGSQKSLKNVSTLLDYNSAAKGSKKYKKSIPADKQGKISKNQQNQQISEEFRGSFQNKAHKLKGPLGKAASIDSEPNSGSNHRGSSSPVQENAVAEAAGSSDDELETHHTGTLWPSQANAKAQNTSKQSSDLSSLWPSTQQSKQVEEAESSEAKAGGGFASFWPSVQQQNKKNQQQKSKKDVVLEERDEEASQESGEVDWLALPVSKPKEPKNQEPPEKSFQQDEEGQKKQFDKPADGATKKQQARCFDDEPVGQHNWNPNAEEQPKPQATSSFGGVGAAPVRDDIVQIDDLPIKPMASDPYNLDALQVNQQKSSNMSDGKSSQGAQKGYDFEKMIDAAMQKFGGAPAAAAPDKPEKAPPKSGPAAAANAEDKSQKKEKDEKQIAVDDKKKELLQKRKKYDPRAAIKKSKQQQNNVDQESLENQPADTSDNKIPQPSRNNPEKLVRSATPVTKTISDVPEDENPGPDGAPNQEQNTSQQMPPQQPRPYLKRKTKAVKVEKGNQYKVEGKSRIDCWQKGDKEASGNQYVYGNRKRKRQSLLKKNQESKTKIGWNNEGSLSPGPRRQPGDRSTGTSPAPFRMNQQKMNFNQVDGNNDQLVGPTPNGNDHQQYMMAVDPADNDYPEMGGGPDSYMNQGGNSMGGYPSYNDPHQQYTNSLLPSSHLSNHLPVSDLETQFELLHGPNQEQFKGEAPTGTASAGISSMDRAAQRMREKQITEMRSELNSHEFKYSMIPFSAYNNSQEVNLYKSNSQIPFLFKDSIPALQKSADFQHMNQAPSLFFKCYSDDLYEAILEDYRSHYVAISNQDLDDDDDGDVDGDEYEEA